MIKYRKHSLIASRRKVFSWDVLSTFRNNGLYNLTLEKCSQSIFLIAELSTCLKCIQRYIFSQNTVYCNKKKNLSCMLFHENEDKYPAEWAFTEKFIFCRYSKQCIEVRKPIKYESPTHAWPLSQTQEVPKRFNLSIDSSSFPFTPPFSAGLVLLIS